MNPPRRFALRVALAGARPLVIPLIAIACGSRGGDRGDAPVGSAAYAAPTKEPGIDAGLPGGAASRPTPRGQHPDQCTGWTEKAAEACAQRPRGGCTLRAPMWCGGVAPSPADEERLSTGPCQCVCQEDIQRCSTVP